MKTKILLVLSGIALLGACVTTVNGQTPESSYNVYVWMVKGPVRANAAEFDVWSAAEVENVYTKGRPSAPLPFDYSLKTADIAQQSPQFTNRTLWFMVRVTTKNPATKFYANKLRFEASSSDTNHYLASAVSLDSDPNFTFTSPFQGVVWNGAPRNSDTRYTTPASGNLSQVPVNETIFIGGQVPYFVYANASQLANIDSYIMNHTNFVVTGKWSLVGSEGSEVAHASKSLATKIAPLRPLISLAVGKSPDNYYIGANMDDNVSAILYSTPAMGPAPVWTELGTINSGEQYIRPQNSEQYFKLVPQ